MAKEIMEVNHVPVLMLWVSVVATTPGYNPEEALGLGKAVAGQIPWARGRNLGIHHARNVADGTPTPKVNFGEDFWIKLCGRSILSTPAENDPFLGSSAGMPVY